MRAKAQTMLAEKEHEIDKLKGRTTPVGQMNTDFSNASSQHDGSTSRRHNSE